MSAAVASAGSKRPRSALSLPTDMSWNEPSLVSGDPSSVSPLEELSRFFASTAAASGSTVNPSPEEQIYVQTASHEDAMLREPWPSAGKPSVYSRPCLFGRRCVCMRSSIEGIADCGGVVLAECMSPAEHEAFEATGAYPQTRRPCVLCARANMTDVYMHARRSVSAGSQVPGFVINWYCNPVGDDAYSKDVCIPFEEDGDVWLGMFGKVAAFLPDRLRMVQEASTKRWFVDQSRMKHSFTATQESWVPAVENTLHSFFKSRKDIWDGNRLWKISGGQDETTYACERMSQLSEAYGMAAGAEVSWALASMHDRLACVCASLARGDPESVAKASVPAYMHRLYEISWILMRAASGFGARTRTRRRRGVDGARASLDSLFSKAVIEGSSARSVSEATARAVETAEGLRVLSHTLSRALCGGFKTCARRPLPSTRARVATLGDADFHAVASSMPTDIPIMSAALVEYAAALVDDGHVPHLVELCGGAKRWALRVDRAKTLMDAVRAGLDTHWTPDAALLHILSRSSLADALRRVHRRAACVPALSNPRPPLLQLDAALTAAGADAAAGEHMPVDEEAAAAALSLVAGDASALSCLVQTQLDAIAAAAAAARQDSLVRVMGPSLQSPTFVTRSLLLCSGCGALKNFVVARQADGRVVLAAAGHPAVAAPNPLDDEPRPRCVESPACAPARLRQVTFEAQGRIAVVGERGVTISMCCGVLCSTNALTPAAHGEWRCLNCVDEMTK